MSNTVTLSKPIKAHGEEIKELKFREPSGDDLMAVGTAPFLTDVKERVHMDFVATGDYIARLAGIPPSSVKLLAPGDFIACYGVIAGFFGASETIKTS